MKDDIFLKGHPGVAKSFGLFDAVRFKMAGFKIIKDDIPASRIINDFDVIAFASSTVGLEAIRRGIPINCLGNWPYLKSCALPNSELVDEYGSVRVDKNGFFHRLRRYSFPGASYKSRSELEKLVQSLPLVTRDTDE